ncbi:SAM-dependent methyltransferase, partial [Psychrobacter sp. 16-Bac2893]
SSSQRTHFEVKYLARQETCWELSMKKPEGYQTRFDKWMIADVSI